MNEVTRIHLGRQPFTISVAAHKALKAYLAAIEKEVGDASVIDEIELRMAELLSKRGVSGDKVVLPDDVDFLKQQLGQPADFSEDSEASATTSANDQGAKRLFRDPDNGLLGGVAAGLAAYFGLDVVLIRIIFVILGVFSGGVGILIYIVFWLMVPPAKTSSEKLQMQGMPVTVDALKQSVSKADLPGTARRVNGRVLPIIDKLFKLGLKLIGLGLIAAGLLAFFGLIALKAYMLLHDGRLFQENLFPVGAREQWLVNLGVILVAIGAVLVILTGITVIRRKWPIRPWATIGLTGILFVIAAATAALSADVGPRVEARYQRGTHVSAIQNIQPFDKVVSAGRLDVEYIPSTTHAVSLRYYGHPDISKIKFTVVDRTLHIDTAAFDSSHHCTMLCLFPKYNLVVEVAAPNLQNIDTGGGEIFYPRVPAYQFPN
jgi:phage shock protein PspC (stress-responsive transcriptional regulator)